MAESCSHVNVPPPIRTAISKLPGPVAILLLLLASGIAADRHALGDDALRPNLLVIAIDDLRDYLGCYGADFVQSPNIDRLAERGVLFERAYCQMALCGPSRSSFFSGARPDTLRAHSNKTHFRTHQPQLTSLPQWFKQHGYRTQGIGKILHNTHRDPPSWTESRLYPIDPQYAEQANAGKRALIDGMHPQNRVNPLFEAAGVDDIGYRDGLIAEAARTAIRELAAQERPFFLMVGFHKPHSPFNAPQKYWDLYDRHHIPLAPNPFPPEDSPAFSSAPVSYLRSFQNIPREGDFSEELAREITHAYLACVSYIDAQIGKLLSELEQAGVADTTVIALWSDHGYQLGHHNLWCKHSNFEAATRVPLIIVDPRTEDSRGTRQPAPVELIDLYPTLADLAGLPIPQHCEGRSLKQAWTGPAAFASQPSIALSQFNKGGYRGRSMRTARYRLTRWSHLKTGETIDELFDHQVDPLENRNAASRPEMQSTLDALRLQLEQAWPPSPAEQD